MTSVLELDYGRLEPVGGLRGVSGCLLFDTGDGYALLDAGFVLAELPFPVRHLVAAAQ